MCIFIGIFKVVISTRLCAHAVARAARASRVRCPARPLAPRAGTGCRYYTAFTTSTFLAYCYLKYPVLLRQSLDGGTVIVCLVVFLNFNIMLLLGAQLKKKQNPRYICIELQPVTCLIRWKREMYRGCLDITSNKAFNIIQTITQVEMTVRDTP